MVVTARCISKALSFSSQLLRRESPMRLRLHVDAQQLLLHFRAPLLSLRQQQDLARAESRAATQGACAAAEGDKIRLESAGSSCK